jgi:glycosyltransferase involved in cell wall biosynthesis
MARRIARSASRHHCEEVAVTGKVRQLLSVGHSYCIALNRRLTEEMERIGGPPWQVTTIAPRFFHGDLSPIRTQANPLEASSLRILPAYLTGRTSVFFYGRELAAALRNSWNVIHCWEEPFILAGGQVAWWTPRQIPIVFWTGQNIAKRYPPPFSWIEQFCVGRCAGWMARGQTGVDALLSKGYGGRPHRVVPMGVDTKCFRPDPSARGHVRSRLAWSDAGPPVIGFLGRFVEEKGLKILTAVLDNLRSKWRALLVGGGPLAADLRQWSRRHPDRVRIVTGVQHDAVPAYLNAMDVLCAPSQTRAHWREVFGRMLIEAFACGVPVVASDSGEIPYVVKDAGVIVGEADHNSWARALEMILEDPSHRRELGARGLERARTVYSWRSVARQHLDFLEEVLEKQGEVSSL